MWSITFHKFRLFVDIHKTTVLRLLITILNMEENYSMVGSGPVRCQKCGKPIGYVTVLAKGLMGIQQPLENVKVVAVCMDCAGKA